MNSDDDNVMKYSDDEIRDVLNNMFGRGFGDREATKNREIFGRVLKIVKIQAEMSWNEPISKYAISLPGHNKHTK